MNRPEACVLGEAVNWPETEVFAFAEGPRNKYGDKGEKIVLAMAGVLAVMAVMWIVM